MKEHGNFDPEIRKQAEEFENSVPGSHERVFGSQAETSTDSVQRLWEQARAFDPNVGKLHPAGEEVAPHRQEAAQQLYEKAKQLDPDKVAQLEAAEQERKEEAA